jgi:hypothetical protein
MAPECASKSHGPSDSCALCDGRWAGYVGGYAEANHMRIMNLPPFPGAPAHIADLGEYLKTQLAHDTVPWPDYSWRLLAHMAWPNDAGRRNLWMAAQIGTQLAQPADGEGASASDTETTPPYLPVQNASWEYFRLFGGHASLAQFANAALHDEIGKIQIRWARVAYIVHRHCDMTGGNHMKRRGGASVGKVIELITKNSRVKGRSPSTVWAIWGEFKDVAHLVAATFLLLHEGKTQCGREGWRISTQLGPYAVVMKAPEAVLAVAKSFQEYGLGVAVHARDEPLLDPKSLWRIPDWVNVEALPLPSGKLATSESRILGARRARSPARVGKRTTPEAKSRQNSTRRSKRQIG